MTERTKKHPIPKAPAYALLYPFIAMAARRKGYALAVHGSMATDFDLIAVPWTEDAVPAEELAAALIEHVDGELREADAPHNGAHGLKPHGRRCWSIHLNGWVGMYIDLSVMPREVSA